MDSYIKEIQSVAKENGYQADYADDYESSSGQMVRIELDADNQIEIEFRYNKDEKDINFSIAYISNQCINSENSNMDLYLLLADIFTEEKLDKQFCDKFIDAPESDYPATASGYVKNENELEVKKKSLDFGENWYVYFYKYNDGSSKLIYYGYTKDSFHLS